VRCCAAGSEAEPVVGAGVADGKPTATIWGLLHTATTKKCIPYTEVNQEGKSNAEKLSVCSTGPGKRFAMSLTDMNMLGTRTFSKQRALAHCWVLH
jgi:hypothetical protein